MAVIWASKGEKRYVTQGGWPPTTEDMRLADEYDDVLKNEFKVIRNRLADKDFFCTKSGLKKWFLLGKELQFLHTLELRKKCDPEFNLTWRALYDVVPDLAPTSQIPSDKERAEGKRNHFQMCYRLAKLPWKKLTQLNWRMWNDICMSFTPDMWEDSERLLEWLITRSQKNSEKVDNRKLRIALIALRNTAGEKAAVKRNTKLLSKENLRQLLDDELAEIKA